MNQPCECELQIAIPATEQGMEQFLSDFRRRTEGRLDEPHRFAAELLMREALNNAVVHGCCADSQRQVQCRVRLKGQRLTIMVADSGSGFDWRAETRRHSAPSDPSGRGMEILRRYSTRVRYNDRGNAVTIFKTLLGNNHD